MKLIKPYHKTKYFGVIAALCLLFSTWYFMSGKTSNAYSKGPSYDLIFGVYIFDPDLNNIYNISPYVIDGKLHLQIDSAADDGVNGSTSIAIYRYNSKSGKVEQLPLPTSAELKKLANRKSYIFTPTKNLKLNTNNESPDGFTLAEPKWVKVNPLSKYIGKHTSILFKWQISKYPKTRNFSKFKARCYYHSSERQQ